MKPAQSRDNWLPWAYFPIQTANGVTEALEGQLESWAIEQGKTVYRETWPNETTEPAARFDLHVKIDETWQVRGGRRVQQAGPLFTVWAGPDGVMLYSGATFEMTSLDPEFLRTMRKEFEKLESVEGAPPVVRVLEAEPGGGYFFNEMKVPSSPFIHTNYSAKVAEQYDLVLGGITSPNPAGRLVLLSGEPGTGKSHFVRGLLEDARAKSIFCLVPPHLLTDLDGPNLVGSLRDLNEPNHAVHRRRRRAGAYTESVELSGKNLVLILEDADSALVPRAIDNMSTIAALLNMSDGIFGAALDLRIIATTNAKSFEIDPAIERPGRLLTHVMFQKLSIKEANGVLSRLGSKERVLAPEQRSLTLAQVYAMAREKK